MSMANREDSEAAEHETFPGPGPLRTDESKRGIRPVEQMVDAAIDRIAREQEAARGAGAGHALARTSVDSRAALAAAKRAGGRLRWKGLDVSAEFREYADRVARGEDLPPFTGKILAEPDAAFPWDATAQRDAERRALKKQAGLWVAVAAFLGLAVWVLIVQVSKQDDWQKPAESPLANVVLSNQAAPAAPSVQTAAPQPAPAEPDTVAASNLAASNTTALASLQEGSVNGTPVPNVAPATTPHASAPAPATAPVGVLVATRAPASDVAVSAAAPRAPVAAPPPLSASPAATGSLSAAPANSISPSLSSSAPLAATAGSAAVPGAAGAGASGVAGGTVAAASDATNSDAKKETGREASAIGPLLVESPSF
jgi:hypothetical protein